MMWTRGIGEFGAVVILAYHPKIVTMLIFERFGLAQVLPIAIVLIIIALLIFALPRLLILTE